MEIKVLGSGCVKCTELERVARRAVEELGIEATVEHVRDFVEIMQYGVMSTPALVVDGQVRLAGRVPSTDEVTRLLTTPAPGSQASGGCSCGGSCC